MDIILSGKNLRDVKAAKREINKLVQFEKDTIMIEKKFTSLLRGERDARLSLYSQT